MPIVTLLQLYGVTINSIYELRSGDQLMHLLGAISYGKPLENFAYIVSFAERCFPGKFDVDLNKCVAGDQIEMSLLAAITLGICIKRDFLFSELEGPFIGNLAAVAEYKGEHSKRISDFCSIIFMLTNQLDFVLEVRALLHSWKTANVWQASLDETCNGTASEALSCHALPIKPCHQCDIISNELMQRKVIYRERCFELEKELEMRKNKEAELIKEIDFWKTKKTFLTWDVADILEEHRIEVLKWKEHYKSQCNECLDLQNQIKRLIEDGNSKMDTLDCEQKREQDVMLLGELDKVISDLRNTLAGFGMKQDTYGCESEIMNLSKQVRRLRVAVRRHEKLILCPSSQEANVRSLKEETDLKFKKFNMRLKSLEGDHRSCGGNNKTAGVQSLEKNNELDLLGRSTVSDKDLRLLIAESECLLAKRQLMEAQTEEMHQKRATNKLRIKLHEEKILRCKVQNQVMKLQEVVEELQLDTDCLLKISRIIRSRCLK